nr:5-formyltetrahydrofolate cyclo-ligase [Liquorilactobacillus ghanensis]
MRQQVLQQLKQKDPTQKLQQEQLLYHQLYDLSAWQKAESIGITMSMSHEINTLPIIKKALTQGKQVYIPKTIHRELKWLAYDPQQLEKTRFGIWEPTASLDQAVDIKQLQLLLVPGVAFTPTGYRVGYGAGFYDRTLSNYPGKSISLVFPEQQIADFLADSWDKPVDLILTPSKIS